MTQMIGNQPVTLLNSLYLENRIHPEIIANGQWIIADMDGTLIGAPGYRKEPTLAESCAKESIFDWLRAGGNLLVLTGCETQRTIERFAQFIPNDLKNALEERRLILGTNGGAVISYNALKMARQFESQGKIEPVVLQSIKNEKDYQ